MKKVMLSIMVIMSMSFISVAWGSEGDFRAIKRIDDLNHASDKIGAYRALLIGINEYQDNRIPDLKTARNDVTTLANILKTRYGFKTEILLDRDATQKAIFQSLRDLAGSAQPDDSVLIYYAGHGDLDKLYNDGWWIPTDAKAGDPLTFLDNVQVQKAMRSMKARHVLLISDSCYSGTLFGRARAMPAAITEKYYLNLYNEKSRWGMTSGNREPVSDSGSQGHSVFAYQLLKALKKSDKPYLTTQEIYTRIAPAVSNNSEQTPLCRPIRNTGDMGGEFVFILVASSGFQSVLKINANIPGARVYVGNNDKGSVPVVLKDIKPGRYRVQVTKAGYEDYLTTVEIQAGKSEEVRAFLKPVSAGPQPGEIWTDPETGMEFVWVPKGCFQMGQTATEKQYLLDDTGEEKYKKYYSDETPRHEVCLDGFWIGKTEVTVGQWRRFVKDTGYQSEAEKGNGCYVVEDGKWQTKAGTYWGNPGFDQDDEHPVACVSWNDAERFVQWVNARGKKSFSLPTEAQWEYAARGGTDTIRFWGDRVDDQACRYANVSDSAHWNGDVFPCDDGYTHTAPVGNYRANPYGLHDMLGNVWEWVNDWYGKEYYQNNPKNNPTGPSSGSSRVNRGGSWSNNAWICRSANRYNNTPGGRGNRLGFRLARTR